MQIYLKVHDCKTQEFGSVCKASDVLLRDVPIQILLETLTVVTAVFYGLCEVLQTNSRIVSHNALPQHSSISRVIHCYHGPVIRCCLVSDTESVLKLHIQVQTKGQYDSRSALYSIPMSYQACTVFGFQAAIPPQVRCL
jgi:hypothetical protein